VAVFLLSPDVMQLKDMSLTFTPGRNKNNEVKGSLLWKPVRKTMNENQLQETTNFPA
jgi:hypothetical protein